MTTVAIIQARMSSTRFPRKVLAGIEGRTMLERVVQRAKRIDGVEHVAIAWPGRDAPREYTDRDVRRYRYGADSAHWVGQVHEDDVLGRYRIVAETLRAEVIVRLTGDCPVLDPNLSSLVLRRFVKGDTNYARLHPRLDGFDTEVFSREALEWAHHHAKSPEDREHVTPIIRRSFGEVIVDPPFTWPVVKLSVDTPEDLERVRRIYQVVGKDVFGIEETLTALHVAITLKE